MRQTIYSLACFLLTTHIALAQQPHDLLVDSRNGADFTTKSVGLPMGTDWIVTTNGNITSTDLIIPHSSVSYNLIITAYGSPAGNAALDASWPQMQVYFDGTLKSTTYIKSQTPVTTSIPLGVQNAGKHSVKIAFTNDAVVGAEDRNLYIKGAQILMTSPPSLSGNAGAFPKQSITIQSGFFPTNKDFFGTSSPCNPAYTGCKNIDLIKKMGATDVTFTSVCTLQAGQDWCSPQINYNDEEAALRIAMRYARSLGMTFTLKPFVLSPLGSVLAGYIAPGTTTRWLPFNPHTFFSSIEANLIHHAQIAREEGASLLMLGTEMGGRFTSGVPMNGYTDSCNRWKTLISNVRASAAAVSAPNSPTLELTYAPTMAGFWNDIDANEAQYVCFWGELDYIGMNAYAHMNYVAQTPPVAKLQSGFNVHKRMFDMENKNSDSSDDFIIAAGSQYQGHGLNFSMPLAGYDTFSLEDSSPTGYKATYATNKYSTKWFANFLVDRLNEKFSSRLTARGKYPLKAIITEVGAPSGKTVQEAWGQPTLDVYTTADNIYKSEQAFAWDGYIRAFYGDPKIAGISVWGLLPNHDASYGAIPGWDVDYDFNGKPAAEVICKWFRKNYVSGTCLQN